MPRNDARIRPPQRKPHARQQPAQPSARAAHDPLGMGEPADIQVRIDDQTCQVPGRKNSGLLQRDLAHNCQGWGDCTTSDHINQGMSTAFSHFPPLRVQR